MSQPNPKCDLHADPDDEPNGESLEDGVYPSVVRSLNELLLLRAQYSTIYADPPWPYSNTAARGAAENHYRTMSLQAILAEPIKELVSERSTCTFGQPTRSCEKRLM